MTAVRPLLLLLVASSEASPQKTPIPGPDYTFPEPRLENVYRAWKPIDYGHPLVDATIHYAPPELERVHLGRGGPVPTRPTQGGNSRKLVFEASRPQAEGHTDHRLQANVYYGKDLVPRDTVVTIPSQRRNDIIQQDPRHGRNQGIKQLPALKSGIFYVDDPHEQFRNKPKIQRRDPTLDRYHGEQHMVEDKTSRISLQNPRERVRYVPVSLLSTPPTLHTPQQPYGDIVNKDFNDLFKKQRRPQTRPVLPPNIGRDTVLNPSRNTVYPLGNPYNQKPSQNFGRPRLEGVLGPPNPTLDNSPSYVIDSRSSSWQPTNSYNVHTSGREIDYRQEPVIFHIKDSGELVNPSLQLPPETKRGLNDRVDSEPGAGLTANSLKESSPVRTAAGQGYRTPGTQPVRTQGNRVRSAPETEEMGYSAAQLYYLCTQEVPVYLHHHLCKIPASLQDTGFSDRSDIDMYQRSDNPTPSDMYQLESPSPSQPPRNRSSPSFYEELTREEDTRHEVTSIRSVSVRLPPKPQFQFVQDNQYVSSTEAMLQQRSLPEEKEEDNDQDFEDNPYQLIYQYSDEPQEDADTPFPYVQGATQGGPAPIVYSVAQSKVVVYRPNEATTTPEPSTTISTTTSPSPPTHPPTTARPFFYQAPEVLPQPPPPPPSIRRNPQRQVIFNKRREGSGGVSRPFEYLSRLSSFLSDRVFTGRPTKARPRPDRPKLITRRISSSARR